MASLLLFLMALWVPADAGHGMAVDHGVVHRDVPAARRDDRVTARSGDPTVRDPDEALYRVLLVRAAPGRLLDLIDTYRATFGAPEGEPERAYLFRHSQGDQWDLMLLVPRGDGPNPRWRAGDPSAEEALDELVSWREELIVAGPPAEEVRRQLDPAGFYHVEMFLALPGRRKALLEQREMENVYLRKTGRRGNLIFTRRAGAAWDLFTVGAYRDLQEFANRPELTDEEADAAARAAGFEAADRIGTYLRTLIAGHHDTLATRVPLSGAGDD